MYLSSFFSFFFNATPPTEIYTLSLHDALPICNDLVLRDPAVSRRHARISVGDGVVVVVDQDRKSTRLNSSHQIISYAVFCLKKKKNEDAVLDLVHLLKVIY